MNEPNWEQFRVDNHFDPPGVKQQKLFAFMAAFLDWRKASRESLTTKPSRKQRRSKVTT